MRGRDGGRGNRTGRDVRASETAAGSRPRTRRSRVLGAFGLAIAALGLAQVQGVGANPAVVRLAIPSYFRSASDWQVLTSSANEVGLALINPNSGPGTTVDAHYLAMAGRLRTAGIRTAGYISTSYGRRPTATVKAEMATYRTMYGITSYFFDEAPNACTETVATDPAADPATDPSTDPATNFDHVAYYGDLFATAHAAASGAMVVINPGTDVPECFEPTADVIVNFEASASTYADWTPWPWVRNYPASKFWHLVHSVPVGQTGPIVRTAASRHAGLVYATTDVLPNPWDSLGDAQSFQEMRAAASRTERAGVQAAQLPYSPAPGLGARTAAGAAGAAPARRA